MFTFFVQTLYVGSSIVAAFGFIVFAAHCHILKDDPKFNWIPLVCFIFIIFSSGMGIMPIPYIIIYEIFPKEVSDGVKYFSSLLELKV